MAAPSSAAEVDEPQAWQPPDSDAPVQSWTPPQSDAPVAQSWTPPESDAPVSKLKSDGIQNVEGAVDAIHQKYDSAIQMASESNPAGVPKLEAMRDAEIKSAGLQPVDALGSDVGPIVPSPTAAGVGELTGLSPTGRPAKILAAAAGVPGQIINALVKPENAIAFTPPGAAAFIAQMAASVPQQLATAAGSYSGGDTDAGDASLVQGLVTAGLLGLPALHAIKAGKSLDDIVGQPTADALRENAQKQNDNNLPSQPPENTTVGGQQGEIQGASAAENVPAGSADAQMAGRSADASGVTPADTGIPEQAGETIVQPQAPEESIPPKPSEDQLVDPDDRLAGKSVTKPAVSTDYFDKAGDATQNPDWWVNFFRMANDNGLYHQENAYQIGAYLRGLGEDGAAPVIDALQQARQKMIDLGKAARMDSSNPDSALGFMTQYPREAIEAARNEGSAIGVIPDSVAKPLKQSPAPAPAELKAPSIRSLAQKAPVSESVEATKSMPLKMTSGGQGTAIVAEMIKSAEASGKQLRDRITNVKYAAIENGKQNISFDLDGHPHIGTLAGRNRDLVLSDSENANRAIAARTFLDGQAKPDIQSPTTRTGAENTKNAPEPVTEEPKAPAQSPALVGLGAAVPSEFARGQGNPTAMKYKLIDQERQQRGLPPITKPESVSDQAVMDKATAEIDKNPELPDQLVKELNSKPRSIDAWERMVLLLHKIDLRDQYEKSAREAAQAFDDSKQFPDRADDMRAANIRTAAISDKLNDLENASRVSGSEQGRGLRALQIMANEDYSLAGLETRARASKGGEPLTDSERSNLVKIADEYKKANDALTQHLADARQKNSELEATKAINEIKKSETPVDPRIKPIVDRVIAAISNQAKSARERIAARQREGRLSAGLDPADLADHAIVGAEYIAKGVKNVAEWNAAMLKEFGDYLKPHLKAVLDAASKYADKMSDSASPAGLAGKVKRALKNMTPEEQKAHYNDQISEKLKAGKKDEITSQVQKLARLFVKQGITDRDALIDAVHNELKKSDPNITRRDTMDAISGYGDFKQLTKDEVSVKLRGLKGEMQQVAKLEDMQKGIPPSKTGIERRTPNDRERALIKAVNEAKLKFQIPITDPLTQLKSALDTKKTQLENQIKDMQAKIDSGDFSKRQKRPLELDRKAQELTAQKEQVAKKFKKMQRDFEKSQLPKSSKALDFISNLRRFSVLSGVNVLGKLGAYSATKLPTIGATEAIGGAISKLPKLSEIAAKAPSEGGLSVRALATATAKGLTKGFMDAFQTATKGQSDLRSAFSNRPESGREWHGFFQTVHEVIKSPLRRAAFELSLAKRMEFAAKNGADIRDPIVQLGLAKDAYLDSDRALLLENNRFANGIRVLMRNLEAKDKNTGRPSLGGKIGATVGRVEFPILSVPLNYVKQTLTSAFGLVSGSIKARAAFKNGIDKLSPQEADAILRHLKYGTIGGAALLYGFYDGYKNQGNGTLGGFYQPGEKRKDNQAGVGGVRIAGHNLPGLLFHNPVIAVAQLGHTMGAILASKINKKSDQTHSVPVAVAASMMGLLNQSPLGPTTELISQLSDPRSAEWAMGEHVKGLVVPQLVQETANLSDHDASGNVIKRKPETIMQHVATGIPGLRQTVPTQSTSPGRFKLLK